MRQPKRVAFAVDAPVAALPSLRFQHGLAWDAIFDAQVERVWTDIRQARAAGKFVVYQSCPISSRGGGFSATNVDIAQFTAGRFLSRFGDRFWVLNPALYQLESKEGSVLLEHHATKADKKLPKTAPSGSDYLRLWARVLAAEPDSGYLSFNGLLGNVDAFYFVGPSDVHAFFQQEGPMALSSGVESYFARKLATSQEMFEEFTFAKDSAGKPDHTTRLSAAAAQQRRDAFIFYYTLKASVAFSKGSHDEWNILVEINKQRARGDLGDIVPAYFDGHQVEVSAIATAVGPGYAV